MDENKTNINWYPGHMAKTKREVSEILGLIDIVIEIIDARIPLSSKNRDIDTLIKNKNRILVISKIDLCDIGKTKMFKKYYEDLGYKVVMLDLLNSKNIGQLINIINEEALKLNEKRKVKGLKERRIRALILGVPNVGKSTLINRLVGKKATSVGNKPGITKKLEWIRINKDMELLDTPGILWPKLDNNEIALNLACMTSIKEEVLNLEEVAIHIINKMLELYPNNFNNRYEIENNVEIIDILNHIGKKIGAVQSNEIDYDKVYLRIIKDLREGYLGQVTFDEMKKE